MRKLPLLLSVAVAMSLAVITGCSKAPESGSGDQKPSQPAAAEKIKIGLAGAETGSDGQIGLSMMNGSQVAIDEWNAKGGVLGKQIESLQLDDEANPQKAVTVAQTLIDAGVVAVIGHFNSGCSIPASARYNDAKIIQISPGSTNPTYTEQGFPYAFRICGRDDQQGAVIADFLRGKLKLDKIAILDDKTTYGEGLAKVVQKSFEAQGGQVVMFQGIGKDERDFRANIAVIKGSGAQALVWGGMYGQGGPLCVQMRQAGLNIPFVSDDGCQDQAFVDTLSKNSADVYLSFGKDFSKLPAAQPFIESYKKKYNRDVGSYSVYGYDAANVLLTAIQKAGTTDAAKVTEILKSDTFDTTLGPIGFDGKGDLKEAGYVIWTVKDGKLQELAPSP